MKKALSIFCFFIIAFVNIFAIDGNAYAFDGEYVDKFGKWYNKVNFTILWTRKTDVHIFILHIPIF